MRTAVTSPAESARRKMETMKQEKLSQEALFEQAQLQEVRALKEAIDRCDDGVGKEYLWAKLDAVVCGLASRVEGIEKQG